MTAGFNPDWTIHPGMTLREALRERGISQKAFAECISRPLQVVNEICMGKRAITARTALDLEKAGMSTARFWVTAQALYELDVARGKQVMN